VAFPAIRIELFITGDQADRARRLARAQIQDEPKALLRIVAQDYDNIAEDPENGAIEIFHPEMLPQP
jgi:hypothetical protein